MARPPYFIDTDDQIGLMTIRFDTVFWDVGVAQCFARDAVAAASGMNWPVGEHLVLVDLRNAVLQTQQVYDQMKSLIGGATAKRIALVAAAPLARMQTKRLQLRDNIVMFAEMNEAAAWLLADTVSTARPATVASSM